MPKSVLVDLTRCIGCRGCQMACKSWNERGAARTEMRGDYTNPPRLNSETYTNIRFVEGAQKDPPVWSFVKAQCMHCLEPACASVCPVAALVKTKEGPVVYDAERCIGCRYCMLACPFQVPTYEWEKAVPLVQKCTFCSERISEGMAPACVKTCATGALHFGESAEVRGEANRRLETGRYVREIYGESEAGGTSWLYISNRPFAELGFNVNVPKAALPPLTWAYIRKIPYVIPAVFAVGTASWLVTRRKAVEEKEGRR